MGFTTTHSHGQGLCPIPEDICAAYRELQRIIARLIELDVIRRDALGDLVAYNTHRTEVVYVTGLECVNGSPESVRTVAQDTGDTE